MNVGKNGSKLNEALQKICQLAKVFLNKPKLLILDEEALKFPGFESDFFIKILFQNLKDSGIFSLSKNYRNLYYYSRVYIIKNGSIKEKGNPLDLVKDKKSTLYKILVNDDIRTVRQLENRIKRNQEKFLQFLQKNLFKKQGVSDPSNSSEYVKDSGESVLSKGILNQSEEWSDESEQDDLIPEEPNESNNLDSESNFGNLPAPSDGQFSLKVRSRGSQGKLKKGSKWALVNFSQRCPSLVNLKKMISRNTRKTSFKTIQPKCPEEFQFMKRKPSLPKALEKEGVILVVNNLAKQMKGRIKTDDVNRRTKMLSLTNSAVIDSSPVRTSSPVLISKGSNGEYINGSDTFSKIDMTTKIMFEGSKFDFDYGGDEIEPEFNNEHFLERVDKD